MAALQDSCNALRSLSLGTVTFVLQLGLQATTGFATLSPKVQSLAADSAKALMSSPEALAWIALYGFLGVLIHATPFALGFKITRDLRVIPPGPLARIFSQRGIGLTLGLAFLATLAAWDVYLFPVSLVVTEGPPQTWFSLLPVIASSTISLALLLLWLLAAASKRATAITLALPIGLAIAAAPSPRQIKGGERAYPDVIIIGVDSLRPDHLEANGGPKIGSGALNALTEGGISFSNAFTPMGRTFVSYMSVLSGQNPISHGVRENLWPRSMFSREHLLPAALRKHGYATLYGIDEVRFSNINSDFGFDTILSPPPGAVEIVVGTLSDTIGMSLFQLMPGADRLIPHFAGNRALRDSYAPSVRVRQLTRAIHSTPGTQPLFLATHLCIAHSPFAAGQWQTQSLTEELQDSPPGYQKALEIADMQVEGLLDALRKAGRLDNALLVFLSDHGEGLGMDKDSFTSTTGRFATPADYGHGNIAIAKSQSQVVLSMQRYIDRQPTWDAHKSDTAASLIDVAPTVLGLLDIEGERTAEGRQLIGINGLVHELNERPIFVESGIFGRSLESLNIDKSAVVDEFAHLYTIKDDLRFELSPEHIPTLMENKQRGVIKGRYGVSSLPRGMKGGCWLVFDYVRRTRACFTSPLDDEIAREYSVLVCEHFKSDVKFYDAWCAREIDDKAVATR